MGTHHAVRRAALGCAAIFVVAAAAVAVGSYDAGRRAGAPRSDPVSRVWLGPNGPALAGAIDERLKSALAALDDSRRDVAERFPAYRAELQTAERLLRRAVLANLADARAIQRLAAVTWELDALDGAPDAQRVKALVDVASSRAPRVPEIQAELGEILFKLGRVDDARPFMARAVALQASMAQRVVDIMLNAGIAPSEILETLPPIPEVLVALKPEFASQGREEEFLSILENHLLAASPGLLETYGDLAIGLGLVKRLDARLARLGAFRDRPTEAARQHQLARAAALRGDQEAAFRFELAAVSLCPDEPGYRDIAASGAIASNHLAEAESLLREGISRLAAVEGGNAWRARLYRGLGEVYERRGRGDQALEFYRRALEQDPQEPRARARIAEIESLLGPKDGNGP